MKVKQEKAVQAFLTIMAISKRPLNSFAAFKLFKLKKALQDSFEFQREQESKLIEEFEGKMNELGNVSFPDTDKATAFKARQKELDEVEQDIAIDRMMFTLKELPELSIEQIETLDTFIEIKE